MQSKTPLTRTLSERQRASLAGLGGVSVGVGRFAPDAEAAGLHPDAIARDVQGLLKRAGIALLTGADGPHLTIQADVRKVGGPASNAYTVFLLVELVQPVIVERAKKGTPNLHLALPTWRLIDYTVLARESLPTLRTRIAQAVGAFVADYKAANGP